MKALRLQTLDEAQEIEQSRLRDHAFNADRNPLAPAYSYGWSEHLKRRDAAWSDAEADLRAGWSTRACNPGLSWELVRDAVRDGWEHVTPPSKH